MSKRYIYQTNRTSPNVNKGRRGKITSITIHHWGSDGQSHSNVVAWLCQKVARASAHYVVSSGLVSCIVDPDDTAWHSGSSVGNRSSIGIECRPEMSAGDFETTAQLIAGLRNTYGPLPLVPHSKWTSTECPGRWKSKLASLSARADEIRLESSPQKPPREPKQSVTVQKLVVDGKLGRATAAALQRLIGVKVDGKLGHQSWNALQRFLKTPVDGIVSNQSHTSASIGYAITQGWVYTGPKSKGSTMVRALQKLIGAVPDGVWGPDTTRKLQIHLNAR